MQLDALIKSVRKVFSINVISASVHRYLWIIYMYFFYGSLLSTDTLLVINSCE